MKEEQRVKGPVEQFSHEFGELIEKWRNKPADDRLTFIEMIGVIEIEKADLLREFFDDEDEK